MRRAEKYRERHRRLADRASGLHYNSPRLTAAQQRAVRHESEIRALPVMTGRPGIQDSTTGAFIAIADFSTADGPDVAG